MVNQITQLLQYQETSLHVLANIIYDRDIPITDTYLYPISKYKSIFTFLGGDMVTSNVFKCSRDHILMKTMKMSC